MSIGCMGFLSIIELHSQISETSPSSLRGNDFPLDETVSNYDSTDYENKDLLKEDSDSNNAEEENMDTKKEIEMALKKARTFISEASTSELEDSTEILHESILHMKDKIKKTLVEVLKHADMVTESDTERLQDEVYKQLENDIMNRFKEQVQLYIRSNEENLHAITQAELNLGKTNEQIERDVKYESSFMVENLNHQIDFIEQELEDTIRTRAQNIEKNVLDRVGYEVSPDQLDEAEIHSHMNDAEEEIMEDAAKSESIMFEEVSKLTQKYKELTNKILEDLLMKNKVSSEELEEIKKTIYKQIDQEFDYLIGDETLMLEDIIEDKLIELEDAADEDKEIIDQATNLGMVPYSLLDSVDIIEKDLDDKKNVFESAIQKSIEMMEGNIMEAMRLTIGEIEKRVFREKGVELSEEEIGRVDVKIDNMNKLIEV